MAAVRGLEWIRPRLMLRRAWRGVFPPPYGTPQGAVINGFPKAGTHLLVRCLVVLGARQRSDFFLSRDLVDVFSVAPVAAGEKGVPVGIAEPTRVSVEDVERRLASLWRGEFAAGHLPYSVELAEILERYKLRMLFILRDPRDVVVSNIYYNVTQQESRLHEYFTQELDSMDERLLAAIVGVPPEKTREGAWLASIGQRLESVRGWLTAPMNYTVRFERLVGPQGGGSVEEQREELRSIARHLGLQISSEQLDAAAARLFGQGSQTFRRGEIGAWKEHFTENHKNIFKRVAGRELIELGYERSLDW